MKHPRNDYNERIQDSQRRIPKDEPVFLLRAQDRLAADTVDFWADAAESNGVDEEVVDAVRDHANLMRDWPKQKLPDTPHSELVDPDMIDLGPPDIDPGAEDPLEDPDDDDQ